jgi:hypothetical protein
MMRTSHPLTVGYIDCQGVFLVRPLTKVYIELPGEREMLYIGLTCVLVCDRRLLLGYIEGSQAPFGGILYRTDRWLPAGAYHSIYKMLGHLRRSVYPGRLYRR